MRKKVRNIGFSTVGAIWFFVMIALIMQIAILTYDYITQRTDDPAMIAVLVLFLIIILSTFCMVFDLVRRKLFIERPTDRILDATDKIAKGDFSVRLPIAHAYAKYDQYDLIAENLNRMAAELEKTELLSVDFVSNVSHEIKTPLAVIQSYSVLLADPRLDDATRERYAATLVTATKRITDLITNVLRLSKLENQQTRETLEPFDLTESLSEVIIGFEPLIDSKNLTLDCDLDDVKITSSRSLLELVWSNLISNAIKFTEPGGTIGIKLQKVGKNVEVRVRDTGCGISAETGARIFEKFYQGDTSHAGEGNGLGLALVKKVIDVLGGDISVSSQPQKGSTFTIVLKDVIDE